MADNPAVTAEIQLCPLWSKSGQGAVGTTGYLINGTGQAFNLSTLSYWFQINTTGVNELATQNMAEPNGGAGAFLVMNNT